MGITLKLGVEQDNGEAILESRGISVEWGGVRALDNVSLHVGAGEIVGLVGPNGAGKTTLINVLTGYVKPDEGTIHLSGQVIDGLSPRKRSRAGLVRTFQDVRMFGGLSVEESVLVCAEASGLPRSAARERTLNLMKAFDLVRLRSAACEALSYGEQRRLAVARALATQPRVLLLDEPAAGLNEVETELLGEEILRIPELTGCSVLLIEHNIDLVTAICARVFVLDHGAEIFRGSPTNAFNDSVVRDAYIGHGFSSYRSDSTGRDDGGDA